MADDGNISKHLKDLTMTQDSENLKPQDDERDIAEYDYNQEAPQEDDELSTEDFEDLNNQIDKLHSALDALEEQNDVIHSKLVELLEANRLARKQFKEETTNKMSSDDSSN